MFKRSREIDDGEDDSKRYKNSSENEVYSLLAPIDSYISASSSFSSLTGSVYDSSPRSPFGAGSSPFISSSNAANFSSYDEYIHESNSFSAMAVKSTRSIINTATKTLSPRRSDGFTSSPVKSIQSTRPSENPKYNQPSQQSSYGSTERYSSAQSNSQYQPQESSVFRNRFNSSKLNNNNNDSNNSGNNNNIEQHAEDDSNDNIISTTKRIVDVRGGTGWSFAMINSFAFMIIRELIWNLFKIFGFIYIVSLGLFQILNMLSVVHENYNNNALLTSSSTYINLIILSLVGTIFVWYFKRRK